MNKLLSSESSDNDSIKNTPRQLVWLLMTLQDLEMWRLHFEEKEDFEKCIEIRNEILRRKSRTFSKI